MTDMETMGMTDADAGMGTGEVHTHLSSHPERGEHSDGRWHGLRPDIRGMTDTAERLMGEARERAEQLRARAGDLGDRAERMVSGARERVEDVFDTVDRARIPERTQSYPLLSLGIAVGVGFLLAGRSEHRVVRTVKAQLRTALAAGLLASIRMEAEGLVRDEIGGLFHRHAD
jgi:ElaB/YqjD/DUF883 family membrane-anchored ribosome-binding protein